MTSAGGQGEEEESVMSWKRIGEGETVLENLPLYFT